MKIWTGAVVSDPSVRKVIRNWICRKRSFLKNFTNFRTGPGPVETSEITHEEMGALVDALGTIAELITGHEDYDQRWSAKTGDLGWQFWSSFG